MHGTDPPLPETRALSGLQQELLRKMELEAATLAAPGDMGLRASYFDLLRQFAGTRTGLAHALLPELGHPSFFVAAPRMC